jgi:hypothetical protein
MTRATKDLRRYYDARTGTQYNVNVRTGIVCSVDGVYPDNATQARVLNAVNRRIRAGRNRREKEAVLRDTGLVKVRGALGGTYWE